MSPPGSNPQDLLAGRALPELDPGEVSRYSRHLLLDGVGTDGQRRLKASAVLCVGTGGLGSPLALYLAAAGVGRIGLVDFDVVEESNLQRQILHGTRTVGQSKLDSAKERILDLNPRCTVVLHPVALSSDNALDILEDYDVIVDGTDNFPTRYLVNDACVMLGKPLVYGSIYKFEGQASVFNYQGGPNYRDLYPQPPPPGLVPSCAEGGVLGVLPGVIGCIQATETLKILLGRGDTLSGRLLLYDALAMKFQELGLGRDPTAPSIDRLIDYHQFCGAPPASSTPESPVQASFERLGVLAVKARLDAGWQPFVLDVRKPQEAQISRLDITDLLRPHEQILAGDLEGIPVGRPIAVLCRSGGRSARVAAALVEAGWTDVTNIEGGINSWATDVDCTLPTY